MSMKERLAHVALTIIAVLAVQAALGLLHTAAESNLTERLERIEARLNPGNAAGGDPDVVRAIESLGRDYLREMEASLDQIARSTGELSKELAQWPGVRRELQEIKDKLGEILTELKTE